MRKGLLKSVDPVILSLNPRKETQANNHKDEKRVKKFAVTKKKIRSVFFSFSKDLIQRTKKKEKRKDKKKSAPILIF